MRAFALFLHETGHAQGLRLCGERGIRVPSSFVVFLNVFKRHFFNHGSKEAGARRALYQNNNR